MSKSKLSNNFLCIGTYGQANKDLSTFARPSKDASRGFWWRLYVRLQIGLSWISLIELASSRLDAACLFSWPFRLACSMDDSNQLFQYRTDTSSNEDSMFISSEMEWNRLIELEP